MTVEERIPDLDDAELTNLHANAVRLQSHEGGKGEAATALIPVIEAELAARKARKAAEKPAKPAAKPRKAPAKKAKATKTEEAA